MAEKNINPLDTQNSTKDESELLESIVAAETNDGKEENLLDIAPDVDVSLLSDLSPKRNIRLLIFKIIFAVLLACTFFAIVFFRTQLTDTFDFLNSTFDIPSVLKDIKSTNNQVRTLQTDVNFNRYLQLNAYLNEFSYYGDAFVQNYEILNSQTASDKEKKEATASMTSVKNSLRDSFLNISKLLSDQFYVYLIDPELIEQASLVEAYELDLKTLIQKNSEEAALNGGVDALRDQKNYLQTLRIIGNSTLRALVIDTDFDTLSDFELYSKIKIVNDLIVNDLSLIQKIKNTRIKWSDILNEIDLRTMAVDTSYSEHYYDLKGGIRYDSYDFDKENNRILISGEITRFDTANFSMLANIVESFNNSLIFEGAEMRSLSKSGSVEEGYKSSVRLNLTLRDPVELNIGDNVEIIN